MQCQRVITSSPGGLTVTWDAKLRCCSHQARDEQSSASWGLGRSSTSNAGRKVIYRKSRSRAEMSTVSASLFRDTACCSKVLASRIKVKLVELRSAASCVCRDPPRLLILCTHTFACRHAQFHYKQAVYKQQRGISVHIHYFAHFHLLSFFSNAYASNFWGDKKGCLHFLDIFFLLVLESFSLCSFKKLLWLFSLGQFHAALCSQEQEHFFWWLPQDPGKMP